MATVDGKYLCARKIHLWDSPQDAERCCNGWIRLMVPLQYGEKTFLGFPVVDPYRVPPSGGLWKPYLIREEETEEIERLLALMPMTFRSSTEANPWFYTEQ